MVRTREDGDRIRPLGGGDKLLSDYFIHKKIDRPLRDLTPLAELPGLRTVTVSRDMLPLRWSDSAGFDVVLAGTADG